MRYLAATLAMAFALGAISTAQAGAGCPGMQNASTKTTVASADGQGAQPSTKVLIPKPKG